MDYLRLAVLSAVWQEGADFSRVRFLYVSSGAQITLSLLILLGQNVIQKGLLPLDLSAFGKTKPFGGGSIAL